VILLSLTWKRMTRNGALAGMLAGAATVVLWPHTGSALYEMVLAFVAATVAIVVVSRLGAPPPAAVQARHERVRAELAATAS
jgi:sodium/proline symporter